MTPGSWEEADTTHSLGVLLHRSGRTGKFHVDDGEDFEVEAVAFEHASKQDIDVGVRPFEGARKMAGAENTDFHGAKP